MSMRFTVFFVFSLILVSCYQTSHKEKERIVVKKPEQTAKRDTVIKKTSIINPQNNIAAILSGVNEAENPLNHLFDSSAWGENRDFINKSWVKLQSSRLDPIEKWSKKELTGASKNCRTVFYPFSGPDFITANSFFPSGNELVMLGLEPIGSLPEIDKFSNEEAKDYCNDFKKSLTDIFQKSYFITAYMLRDFQKQKVNGLLPVLSFFIKKTNHTILKINYLVKYNNDSIGEVDYNSKLKPFGVKIRCSKNDSIKTVYYFKYDVSNKQFNDTCAFYKFIDKHTLNSVTYIKSASYLLHANFMSNMKKLILKNSNYVLEDDTGIPYNDIAKAKNWEIKLYGKYTQPVKDFPYLKMQTGILEAFQKDSASIPDVPFHLGYHWQSKKDLLIYATKKNK